MIEKTCAQCARKFSVYPSWMKRKFCCVGCANKAQTKAETREIECVKCGNKFQTKRDHGEWPKYCGKECFLKGALKPEQWADCGFCGSAFLAERSGHGETGYRRFCSMACTHKNKIRGDQHTCIHCGGAFHLQPSRLAKRGEARCCSQKCHDEFYKGIHHFKYINGSHIHSTTGEKYVLLERPGYVAKYIGEHRLIVSKIIGRMVTRGERVIRVNRDPLDNRPENLFICESNSEFSKRRNGSLPWPTKSNLHEWRAVDKPN